MTPTPIDVAQQIKSPGSSVMSWEIVLTSFGQTAHFLDHGHQRIDLHQAAALEILQHRGLVRADLARALDAAFGIFRKPGG
jgi:hypothetical protein